MAQAKKVNVENVLVSAAAKASKLLVKNTLDFGKVMAEVNELPGLIEDLGQQVIAEELKILDAQGRLAEVEASIPVAQREARAELELQIKENHKLVLARLLSEDDLEACPNGTVGGLRADLETAKLDNEDAIRSAVGRAEGVIYTRAKAELTAQELEHKSATASLEAQVDMQAKQIEFLNTQLRQAEANRTADRDMAIKIEEAKANSAGITVNNK